MHEQFWKLKELGLKSIQIINADNESLKPVSQDDCSKQGLFKIHDSSEKISFALVVKIIRRPDSRVIWLEGAQRIVRVLTDQTPGKKTAIFTKRIPTSPTLTGEYATKNNDFQGNSIWFVSLAQSKLQMWEIAIVTVIKGGYSRYYLSLQLVYQADMYNKDEKIWIPPEQFPGYEKWQSLQLFLTGVIDDLRLLKPASAYQPDAVEANTKLSANHAQILWFNQSRRRGLVKLGNGQIIHLDANHAQILWFNQARRYGLAKISDSRIACLHASQVLDQEFPTFEPGQLVLYKSVEVTPKGFDLMGVREI